MGVGPPDRSKGLPSLKYFLTGAGIGAGVTSLAVALDLFDQSKERKRQARQKLTDVPAGHQLAAAMGKAAARLNKAAAGPPSLPGPSGLAGGAKAFGSATKALGGAAPKQYFVQDPTTMYRQRFGQSQPPQPPQPAQPPVPPQPKPMPPQPAQPPRSATPPYIAKLPIEMQRLLGLPEGQLPVRQPGIVHLEDYKPPQPPQPPGGEGGLTPQEMFQKLLPQRKVLRPEPYYYKPNRPPMKPEPSINPHWRWNLMRQLGVPDEQNPQPAPRMLQPL